MYVLLAEKCKDTVEFTHRANVRTWYVRTRTGSHNNCHWPHPQPSPHVHSVHAAHGIASVHHENKIILWLLLKIVKL